MIPDRLRPHMLPLALLLTAVMAVYARTLGHDFLMNWDDNAYVTANSSVHGFSAENLRAVFTSFYAGNYAPLQMLSYMADYTFWGLWPGGYLLTNVLLHLSNGLLLYLLLLRSDNERLMAAVAAGIFLLHPLQVESVAWISQRKTLLAMLFMLISWWAYLRYRRPGELCSRRFYLLSLAAFACSLLSKSAAVFFPAALLLYDFCCTDREQRLKLLDKMPFFVLALAAALLTLLSQSPEVTGWSGLDYGGRSQWHGGSPWATLLTMLPVLCSYLRMIVCPFGLSVVYSPEIFKTVAPPVVAAFCSLLVIGGLAWRLYRRDRCAGYWPIFSGLAIMPVLQLVPLVTIMNDRYLYFPMIGVAALGGFGAVALGRRCGEKAAWGATLVILLLLMVSSFERVAVWQDSRTLWRDAIKKVPGKFDAWEGLGEAYHLSQPVLLNEAEHAYARAFAIYSSSPVNLFNFARVKLAQGDEDRGLILLQRLLTVNPAHVMGWAALGDIYLGRSDFQRAESAYLQAERLQPEALQVKELLIELYQRSGKLEKARDYRDRLDAAERGSQGH